MSDGNFNRNLLPYNSYQSGFRAGHARMKQQALEALIEMLHAETLHIWSKEEKDFLISNFQSRLSKSTP